MSPIKLLSTLSTLVDLEYVCQMVKQVWNIYMRLTVPNFIVLKECNSLPSSWDDLVPWYIL